MKVATSKSSVKGEASNSLAPPTHALLLEHKSTVKGACLEEGEVGMSCFMQEGHSLLHVLYLLLQLDPNEFAVFSEWLSDVTQRDHPYLAKVAREDIQPCLSFSNAKVQLGDSLALETIWCEYAKGPSRVIASTQQM